MSVVLMPPGATGEPTPLVPRDCPLSARELQILRLLATGLTYKAIAAKLNVSVSTIRTHLHNIYVKLGVRDRAQATILAAEEAWLDTSVGGSRQTREIRLLRTVESILSDLLAAVDKRRERLHITRSQDLYLSAFERYLTEPLQTVSDAQRQRMVRRLSDLLEEAGLDPAHVSQQRRAA